MGARLSGTTMVREPAHGRRPSAARALPRRRFARKARKSADGARYAGGQPPAAAGGRLRRGGIPRRPGWRTAAGAAGAMAAPAGRVQARRAPSRTTPTACSCAPRPWRWKRCSCVKCRAARFSTPSPRRREWVDLTPELRQKTQQMADEMNDDFARGYTPRVKPGKRCNACSMKELCLPALCRRADAAGYIRAHLREAVEGGGA